MNATTKWEVQHETMCDGWVNYSTVIEPDGTEHPETFGCYAEALESLIEEIRTMNEDHKADADVTGDEYEPEDLNQYRIVPVGTGSHATWTGGNEAEELAWRIAAFDLECGEANETDTETAWELLRAARDTLAGLVSTGPVTLKVVFGEGAVQRWEDNPDATDAEITDSGDGFQDGDIEHLTFATGAEADAYLLGVEDMGGWLKCAAASDSRKA